MYYWNPSFRKQKTRIAEGHKGTEFKFGSLTLGWNSTDTRQLPHMFAKHLYSKKEIVAFIYFYIQGIHTPNVIFSSINKKLINPH